MARPIATGLIDIQLIGLPNVKRQLENVPRLMDGVARATISVNRQIRSATISATSGLFKGIDRSSKNVRRLTHELEGFKQLQAEAVASGDQALASEAQLVIRGIERQIARQEKRIQTLKSRADKRAEHVRDKSFTRTSFEGLRQFREATLGTGTLQALKDEEAALARLQSRIDMTDKANKAFVIGERERIAASREAINLERMRVLEPAKFRMHEMKRDIGVGFQGFEESLTHGQTIQKLRDQKRALAEWNQNEASVYSQRTDAAAGSVMAMQARKKMQFGFETPEEARQREDAIDTLKAMMEEEEAAKKVRQAYVDETGELIDKELALRAANAQTGVTLLRLRGERQTLNDEIEEATLKYGAESAQVASLTIRLRQLDDQIKRVAHDHEKSTNALGKFNQRLKDGKELNRAAGYRAQQLSFAAQDAVQVWGQTGFAGALHASANNLSMFVQTLDIANPKLLAFSAFGITAGMIALSEWLKHTKKEVADLGDEMEKFVNRIDERFRRSKMLRDAGELGPSGLAIKVRDAAEESSKSRQEAEAQRSFMASSSRYETDFWQSARDNIVRVFTGSDRRVKGTVLAEARKRKLTGQGYQGQEQQYITARSRESGTRLSVEDLRKEFAMLVGNTEIDTVREVYKSLGYSGEKLNEAVRDYEKALRDGKQSEIDHTRLVKLASESIGALSELPFASSGQELMFSIDRIVNDPSIPDFLKAVAASEVAMSLSVESMTKSESAQNDFASATGRLKQEYQAVITGLRQRNADARAVQNAELEYKNALKEVADAQRSHARGIDDIRRESLREAMAPSRTRLDEISQRYEDREMQWMRRIDDQDGLSPTEKAVRKANIINSLQQQRQKAEADYVREMWNSVRGQQFWNNQFAKRQMELDEAYREESESIRKSGLPQNVQSTMQRRLDASFRQQSAQNKSQETASILQSRFGLGREGGGDSKTEQMISAAERTAQLLEQIAFDPHLSPAEKRARSEIAAESHKKRISDIKEQFNRIGMSDPGSLHKQIQLSLREPESLKLQRDANNHLHAANSKLAEIAAKAGTTLQ